MDILVDLVNLLGLVFNLPNTLFFDPITVDTSYSVDTCALVACCLRNAFPYTRGTYVTECYRSFIRFNM